MEWSLQNQALRIKGITTRPLGRPTALGRNTGRPRTTPVAVERTPEAGGDVLWDPIFEPRESSRGITHAPTPSTTGGSNELHVHASR